VSGAGLGRKQFGAGWEGVRGGCKLEVCGIGQDFSNSCECRAEADKYLQIVQGSGGILSSSVIFPHHALFVCLFF